MRPAGMIRGRGGRSAGHTAMLLCSLMESGHFSTKGSRKRIYWPPIQILFYFGAVLIASRCNQAADKENNSDFSAFPSPNGSKR